MAVTVAVTYESEGIMGPKAIAGTLTMDADYDATSGGIVADLSDYLSGTVVVVPACNLGYVPEHSGTAAAGKIQVYEAGADGAALDEVADSTDLSNIVFKFHAMGLGL